MSFTVELVGTYCITDIAFNSFMTEAVIIEKPVH